MIRIGNFTKQGYKDNFSKGELARELVCMNNDYDNLKKENQKLKEVIDNLSESVEGHYDGFTTINEFGACNDIIELLLEFKEILKDVEFIKKWSD